MTRNAREFRRLIGTAHRLEKAGEVLGSLSGRIEALWDQLTQEERESVEPTLDRIVREAADRE